MNIAPISEAKGVYRHRISCGLGRWSSLQTAGGRWPIWNPFIRRSRARETYDIRPNNPTLIWHQYLWHLGHMSASDLTIAERGGRSRGASLRLRSSNAPIRIRSLQLPERNVIYSAGRGLGGAVEPR